MSQPNHIANEIVSKLDTLPTLPAIVYKLSQVINNPMSSTKDVESVMQDDPSMTAQILKLANSSYYAIPGGVSNLSRAIAYIGYDTIQQLVLCTSIFQTLGKNKKSEFNIEDFWKHSVGVALAAETIATSIHHPMPSDIFTCGLVHDLGKVALYTVDHTICELVTAKAKEMGSSSQEAERQILGTDHTEIGRQLAQKWKLPQQLQAAIHYHHELDPKNRNNLSAEINLAVDIVFVANLCVHALNFGFSGHQKVIGIPKEVLSRLTISPETGVKPLLKTIHSHLHKADEFLKIIGPENEASAA